MTVAAASTVSTYALAGTNVGPFDTVFPYEADGDVQVWLTTTGAPVQLDEGPDFALVGADPLTSGGQVTLDGTLPGAGWPAGASLSLIRSTTLDQPSSFGEALGFSPQAVEAAIDHVERQVQDMRHSVGGADAASPLAVKGDLYGFSNTDARIPVGPDGYVLVADSTQALGVTWAPASEGGPPSWADITAKPASLASLGAIAGAADQVPYFNGVGSMVTASFTAVGRQLAAAASLAAVLALVTPLTTKGDLSVYAAGIETRLPVGADTFVLTADSTQASGVKWAAPSGGGSSAWGALTGVPANIPAFTGLAGAANQSPYFTGAGAMALTSLTAFGRSLMGAANGAAAAALIGVAASPFPPLTQYGAAEDGVTDDNAALNSWLADATAPTVWVSKMTAISAANGRVFTKRPLGTGNFHFTATGDYVPASFVWLTAKPAVGVGTPGSGNDYNFSGDLSHVDARYTILGRLVAGGNIRRSPTETYYESVTTPKWDTLNNYSGWSGITCRLTAGIAIGATTAPVNATGGVTTGDTLCFLSSTGAVLETRAVTVVDGTHLSWAGGLANAYAINGILTHGPRTMSPIQYQEIAHFGGGDAYGIVTLASNSYAPTAGQQHWAETATVGLYGGGVAFGSSGVYATGLEIQYADSGFDVTVIGHVESFTRTNQTGAAGAFWCRDWTQATGIDSTSGLQCPIDAYYVMRGWARVGIDMGGVTFLGAAADTTVQPAIQLGKGHRIYFNASTVQGTVGAGGRGSDPRGIESAMYCNTPGDMYIGSTNDGTSDCIDIKFDRAGGSRMRMRPDSISFNNPVQFGNQINVLGPILMAGGNFNCIGVGVYWNNGTSNTHIAG